MKGKIRMDKLQDIVQNIKASLAKKKKRVPLEELKTKIKDSPATRDFTAALLNHLSAQEAAVIAEIKKASPSLGLIRKDYDVESLAKDYEEGGAVALSVVTTPYYFEGDLTDLKKVKNVTRLPILRKDFIIDSYQVYESRLAGADAILLIASILEKEEMEALEMLANELELAVLAEIHNKSELIKVQNLNTPFLGVNNRNLKTLTMEKNLALKIKPQVSKKIHLIAESGIKDRNDITTLIDQGVCGFLVGSSLLQQQDVKEALQLLTGKKIRI